MGLFDRWRRAGNDDPDEALKDSMARIFALHPHLRLASRAKARLAPAMRQARARLRDMVAALPGPRELSARTWAEDPYVHAFFATPHDVTLTVTRSPDLQACFDTAPAAGCVVAVMGLLMNERRTLGVALEGEVMRSDVPRTTVSFQDHRFRLCAPDLPALRDEIEARLLDQLAMQAMGRQAGERHRGERPGSEAALLAGRLGVLQRAAMGAEGMLGAGTAPDTAARQELESAFDENERALTGAALPGDRLERQFDMVVDVLTHADAHFEITTRRLRLDAMNVAVQPTERCAAADLDLQVARVPGDPPFERLFALVRVARADMLPSGYLLDRAEQFL